MNDKITAELRDIQSYLEITVGGSGAELQDRISDLQVYLARSGEIVAITERLLKAKKAYGLATEVLDKIKADKLSAGVQNAMLDAICIDESFNAKWAERINRTIVHQIDATRSLLSYEKEGMRLNNTGY